MKNAHFVLQGKGGIGKSLVANVLAQYLHESKRNPTCIDTDPVNQTLASVDELNAHHIDLMDDEDINPRYFDEMIELVFNSEGESVIDSGSSAFVPISSYLSSNDVFALLKENEINPIVHTVIAGGQSYVDTVVCFRSMAEQFNDCTFVIWKNPYLGELAHEGDAFEQSEAYKQHKDKIVGIIDIKAYKKETHSQDMTNLLKRGQTFTQAIEDSKLTIMTRQRLKGIKKDLFDSINGARI